MKISKNKDNRFDLSLSEAEGFENDLAKLLQDSTIELKTERGMWYKTGNICIEFEWNGKPSGIATSEADWWTHELRLDGKTVAYITIPRKTLRRVLRPLKDKFIECGDDKKGKGIIINLHKLFRLLGQQ